MWKSEEAQIGISYRQRRWHTGARQPFRRGWRGALVERAAPAHGAHRCRERGSNRQVARLCHGLGSIGRQLRQSSEDTPKPCRHRRVPETNSNNKT
jgi:hypothetical protein